MSESEAVLAAFTRYLETFSTLGDLLEFGLDQTTKILRAAQGSLYLSTESSQECFRLRLCCGACPLDVADQLVTAHVMENEPSPELISLRDRVVTRKEFLLISSVWTRVVLPLCSPLPGQPPLGLLVLHFSTHPPSDEILLRDIAEPIARNIHELRVLEEMRRNHYAKARRLAKDTHDPQVAVLAMALAEELGINEREAEEIRLAALLRDVGAKDECLKAARSLTPQERHEVRQHVQQSAQMLRELGLPERVVATVHQHHESFDGSGYPGGLAKDNILIGARVVAVAQTFSALISERPYRGALPAAQAMNVVQELAGSQLDPEIVASLPFAIIRARCEANEDLEN